MLLTKYISKIIHTQQIEWKINIHPIFYLSFFFCYFGLGFLHQIIISIHRSFLFFFYESAMKCFRVIKLAEAFL